MQSEKDSQKKYYLIFIVSVCVIVIFGIVIPRWFVSDGTERLTDEQKSFAQYALLKADNENFENPLLELLIQKVRVQSLQKTDEQSACVIYDQQGKEIKLVASYEAKVKALTFFAIPFLSALITCEKS